MSEITCNFQTAAEDKNEEIKTHIFKKCEAFIWSKAAVVPLNHLKSSKFVLHGVQPKFVRKGINILLWNN